MSLSATREVHSLCVTHRERTMTTRDEQPATMTVEQAGQLLGISRRSAYRAAAGSCPPCASAGASSCPPPRYIACSPSPHPPTPLPSIRPTLPIMTRATAGAIAAARTSSPGIRRLLAARPRPAAGCTGPTGEQQRALSARFISLVIHRTSRPR